MDLLNPLVSIEWDDDYSELPTGMQHVHAVVVGDKVYIGGGMTDKPELETNIYVFDHTKEKPKVTPISTPGPTRWSTLATIHSKLVLAGGAIHDTSATNEVWVLRDDGSDWDQSLPPMRQACWGASAATSGDYLTLAGGVESRPTQPLDTVQIYDASSKRWEFAEPLPKSCYFMKSVFYNDEWYLAGGRMQDHDVFHTSLSPTSPDSLIASLEGGEDKAWNNLPKLSQVCSSLSVCRGQLLAVGGQKNTFPIREILAYSTEKRAWITVEHLPDIRETSYTIHLPTEEILLIGGNTTDLSKYHSYSPKITKGTIKEARSLDEQFSLTALAHIEIVTGIKAFHSLACGETDAGIAAVLRPNSKGRSTIEHSRKAFNEWLIRDNTHTWKALIKVFRHMGMKDVVQSIEDLFTNGKQPPAMQNKDPKHLSGTGSGIPTSSGSAAAPVAAPIEKPATSVPQNDQYSQSRWRRTNILVCFAVAIAIVAVLIAAMLIGNPDIDVVFNLTKERYRGYQQNPTDGDQQCGCVDLSKPPTLPLLFKFHCKDSYIDIPSKIRSDYMKFGILLLKDTSGAKIHDIAGKHREDGMQITTEILKEWLAGKGKPVTWWTLIEVLKDVEFSELAKDIELRCIEHCEC